MASSLGRKPAQGDDSCADPIDTLSAAVVRGWVQLQQQQWKALAAWQQSFATFSKDFWEQWACRYAGGVPIDG